MIPRTSSGRGFKGAAAYYLHDKGASTADRVRFTHTLNLANDNPRRAVAEMIYTAENAAQLKAAAGTRATGRKLEKPVYTFSLSWHPSEKPTDEQMRQAGQDALQALKMDGHQVLMVAHHDTEHAHIHLMVNRVHPETGVAHPLKKDHLILSKWAEKYERDHGHTWCADRVKNNEARRQPKRDGHSRKFVKDIKGQERDRRPEYDRRSQALKAKLKARAAQLKAEFEQAATRQAEMQKKEQARPAFEQWLIGRVNAMQDRHNEERGDLGRRIQLQRLAAEQKIEHAYGASLRQLTKRLAVLEEQARKGRISRLLDRLQDGEMQRKLIRLELANIAQRSGEVMGQVEKQAGSAREFLAARHKRELEDHAVFVERQIQAGYRIPAASPEQDRDVRDSHVRRSISHRGRDV